MGVVHLIDYIHRGNHLQPVYIIDDKYMDEW